MPDMLTEPQLQTQNYLFWVMDASNRLWVSERTQGSPWNRDPQQRYRQLHPRTGSSELQFN